MSEVEVIDLCGASPVSSRLSTGPVASRKLAPTAPRKDPPAAYAAALPGRVINLLGDEDDVSVLRSGRKRPRKEAAEAFLGLASSRRFKTDPNDRNPDVDDTATLRENVKSGGNSKSHDAIELVDEEVQVVREVPASPESQVLEIFPDAEIDHVKKLLEEHDTNVALVLSLMAEHSYPKTKSARAANTASASIEVHTDMNGQWKYDYASVDSFSPSPEYVSQTFQALLKDFPFLSREGAKKIMVACGNHYAVCHDKIVNSIKGSKAQAAGEDIQQLQYNRLKSALDGKKLESFQSGSLEKLSKYKKVALKTPRKSFTAPAVTDTILVEEINFVECKMKEWMGAIENRAERQKRAEAAERADTAVDCSCCYGKAAVEDMISCRNKGHLFCVDCINSFAENQLFGSGNLGFDKDTKKPSLELKCFHGDGCSSGFSRPLLEKALAKKTLQKHDEMQAQISIDKAGLDLATCPKCNFQASLDPAQKIFQCPVASCRFESCRECGEASHIPLRCDEVEKEKETKGRLTVEEAITRAKIRQCPKCKKSFVKSDGCNKVVCGCGNKVCYVCCKSIKGYEHFCQTPHCQHKDCNKCPLHTNDEQDDARAMREAGIKAASEVSDQVQINVDDILKAGDPAHAQKK